MPIVEFDGTPPWSPDASEAKMPLGRGGRVNSVVVERKNS